MAKENEAMPIATLFTGEGCHLCEQAGRILDVVFEELFGEGQGETVAGRAGRARYEVVSITGNEALMAIYGERIPVVKTRAGDEKGWPFTVGQIKKMLAG